MFEKDVAASAFNQIPRGHRYERIFLLGPSHRVGFNAARPAINPKIIRIFAQP